MSQRLEPKLFTVLREGYGKATFVSDLTSGVIVAIVALPLAIAFAIASGVKPEQGLYTAIIAGVAIALFGGSRTQISGPTGAFIVVIYAVVQKYGYEGLAVATLLAGGMLIIMGLLRMGTLLKFIPYPLTVGFTSGIALIIFSSQFKDLLGLDTGAVPAEFTAKWVLFAGSMGSVNLSAVAVSAASILIIVFWPHVTRRIPGSLVAIIVSTVAVQLLSLPVDTIGSRFGQVPSTLPAPHIPNVSWSLVRELFSPALTIALLGAIESLLSAVVADGMMGTRHRSNMELIGQGIGNMLSPLFGGIPATGAIARTATNIRNGGKTPVSALVHSLVLLLIMLFFGRWAALIPMPSLAAILVVVAYNMSEWRTFRKLLRYPKSDVIVLVATFLLTVLIDLTVAIEAGIVLSALLLMKRMSDTTEMQIITRGLAEGEKEEEGSDDYDIASRDVPEDVTVFEVQGSLFFGAVEQFKETLTDIRSRPRVFILRMRHVRAIDATGLQAIEDLVTRLRKENVEFLLSGAHAQPMVAMESSGLLDLIGEANLCGNIDEALKRARTPIEAAPSR
ncbi:MAG: STAS domain-containing protein [Bacteroidetes bacterium]|nr:STAS domain-containing protein [Bacteroidota bacterium]